MMDWLPVVLLTFKIGLVFVGMFYAIKWHYDQGNKGQETDMRAVLLTGGKVAAVFVLSVMALIYVTFSLATKIGLDLTLS